MPYQCVLLIASLCSLSLAVLVFLSVYTALTLLLRVAGAFRPAQDIGVNADAAKAETYRNID
jgi:hypothetical protein